MEQPDLVMKFSTILGGISEMCCCLVRCLVPSFFVVLFLVVVVLLSCCYLLGLKGGWGREQLTSQDLWGKI